MTNALKRSFKEGERVYVVDYWGTSNGTQAFEAQAEILKVDVKAKTFTAVLYGDTYCSSTNQMQENKKWKKTFPDISGNVFFLKFKKNLI